MGYITENPTAHIPSISGNYMSEQWIKKFFCPKRGWYGGDDE